MNIYKLIRTFHEMKNHKIILIESYKPELIQARP